MGEVQVSPENWNDIILESDGNILMQYVVYDPALVLEMGHEDPCMLLLLKVIHRGLWT